MKILHAPCNIAGQAGALAQAEREVSSQENFGAWSWSVNFYPGPFDFKADRDYLKFLGNSRSARVLGRLCAPFYGAKAALSYDVFHFYFGNSFLSFAHALPGLNLLDLPILKRMGRRCFMTFQGSDARQREVKRLEGAPHRILPTMPNSWLDGRLDDFKRTRIEYIIRHCEKTFCLNPDLVPLVPGSEFIPYASVDVPRFVPKESFGNQGRITILHAPSNRTVKGTSHVIEAVEILRQKYPVELVLVEGMSHAAALEKYRAADLVVDQLIVGWYGGLAVEVMAMGIPVVAFLASHHLTHVPSPMRGEIPVVSANPDNLVGVLEELITQPQRLQELGRRSRAFVQRWHAPHKIARAMLKIYQDPHRKFWELFDEKSVR